MTTKTKCSDRFGWILSSGCLDSPQAASGHLPQTALLHNAVGIFWTQHNLVGVHTFLDRIWTQPGNGGMTRLSACCNLLKETPPSLHLTPWPESKSSNEIRDMSELKEQDQQTVVKILLFP